METTFWSLFHKNTMMFAGGYIPCNMPHTFPERQASDYCYAEETALPVPNSLSSLDQIIISRKSSRHFSAKSLPLEQLSKLLFLSSGLKTHLGYLEDGVSARVVPSAGARYPIEVNIFSLNVQHLPQGTYHFSAERGTLQQTSNVDFAERIITLCNGQEEVRHASAVIALCADFSRTIEKYGERGYRFAHLDAGHIAQNIYLLAEELNLKCLGLGGYWDIEIKQSLRLPANEYPVYLLAVGY